MEQKDHLSQRVSPVWTIWFPLGMALVLIVVTAIAYLIAYFTGGEIDKWTSGMISLAFAIIAFSGLIIVCVLVFGISGMKELASRMPIWMSQLQVMSTIGNQNGHKVTNAITKPVMLVRQGVSGVNGIIRRKRSGAQSQ